MNDPLETILKRMENSGHSETILVAEHVSDMIAYAEDQESEEFAQQIDDSMDEVIAAAKIIKAWAKVKGVPV